MVALKYLLAILGIGLFGSAGALVVYDVYISSQLRRLLRRSSEEAAGGAWRNMARASAPLNVRFMPGPLAYQVPRFFAALFRPGISVTACLVTSLPRRHVPRSGSASASRW